MKKDYTTENFLNCPFADIQQIVHGKWAMVVIYFVSKGTIRFGELSRKLPMITQANLTKELRMLENFGLIHREVYREVPPKVEYSLTDIGREFLPVLEAIDKFSLKYQEYKKENKK